jgi:hypothetical protein
MKKLKLQLDALRVESFVPAAVQAEKGTVRAHDAEQAGLESTNSYLRPCFYTEQRTCTC